MTKPDKDHVMDASNPENNTGVGSSSPSFEPNAKAEAPADSYESAAGDGLEDEILEAEVIEPAAEADSDIVAEAEAVLAADELEKAKAAAVDWQDKYMRLHAEWDTYRRRMNEQREEEKKRATEKLVTNLLPVIDDFERTIDYATKNGETGLLGGVEAVHAKLLDVLSKDGVQVIDPAGEPFNALEAQAVAMVPDDSVFDETVASVYQKGYRLGVKVLRPAMVTVTTGGPARPKEDIE